MTITITALDIFTLGFGFVIACGCGSAAALVLAITGRSDAATTLAITSGVGGFLSILALFASALLDG